MARKQPKLPAKVERKDMIELIAKAKAHLLTFEEGTEEWRTWQRYIDASHEEAVAEAELDLIYERVKDLDIVPDKLQAEYQRVLDAFSRRANRSMGALLAHQHVLRNTFTVDDKDVEQLILDALGANLDALPEEYAELDPLARHREYKRVAADLMADWKSNAVKVRDNDQMPPAPMCADCEAEIAA